MNIRICADSTCDLSPELVERYHVVIIPLYVVKGGVSCADGIDITPQDIYDHVAAGGEICSTSAVAVADYEAFFRRQLETCDELVHFNISGEMSACWQNACLAAAETGRVYPVDSRNLSTGIGQLVIEAALMAETGKYTGAEIRAAMQQRREKLDVSFLVSTLAYLRKGGRCSAVAALGANLLGLKPCIEVRDGKMGVGKKYRGKMDKCLEQYVRDRLAGRDDIDLGRIFITDSGGFTEAERAAVEQAVRACQPFREVLHTQAGCTVSSHCGPGTLGILYFHK